MCCIIHRNISLFVCVLQVGHFPLSWHTPWGHQRDYGLDTAKDPGLWEALWLFLCLLLHFHYNPLFLSISSTFFLHAVLFVSLLSLFLVLSFTPSLLQSLPFCLSINISLCLSLFVSLSFLFLSFPLFLSPSLFNSLSPPFPAHFLFSYILGHVKKTVSILWYNS